MLAKMLINLTVFAVCLTAAAWLFTAGIIDLLAPLLEVAAEIA